MSTYKVHYFNFRGAGEPIRFLLSFANVDFEDARFEEEEWEPLKECKFEKVYQKVKSFK
jgi:glutathione S-transferase